MAFLAQAVPYIYPRYRWHMSQAAWHKRAWRDMLQGGTEPQRLAWHRQQQRFHEREGRRAVG